MSISIIVLSIILAILISIIVGLIISLRCNPTYNYTDWVRKVTDQEKGQVMDAYTMLRDAGAFQPSFDEVSIKTGLSKDRVMKVVVELVIDGTIKVKD